MGKITSSQEDVSFTLILTVPPPKPLFVKELKAFDSASEWCGTFHAEIPFTLKVESANAVDVAGVVTWPTLGGVSTTFKGKRENDTLRIEETATPAAATAPPSLPLPRVFLGKPSPPPAAAATASPAAAVSVQGAVTVPDGNRQLGTFVLTRKASATATSTAATVAPPPDKK
eukprot:TRINITY_DN246_c0_g1_i4.p3 TRINITY_DN246_c0_g1~~TRINITY_DN246_c0_g1_i4.p3  ORF type:complete len:172 (-),score=59.60 TRINITY_DN246_c0_g1_i4:125-640(-)